MMASKHRTLYAGVTGDLTKRVWQHKTHFKEGFSDRYNCERLIWLEMFNSPGEAIYREKQIKGWVRKRKVELIVTVNPAWDDLAAQWFEPEEVARVRAENLALRGSKD